MQHSALVVQLKKDKNDRNIRRHASATTLRVASTSPSSARAESSGGVQHWQTTGPATPQGDIAAHQMPAPMSAPSMTHGYGMMQPTITPYGPGPFTSPYAQMPQQYYTAGPVVTPTTYAYGGAYAQGMNVGYYHDGMQYGHGGPAPMVGTQYYGRPRMATTPSRLPQGYPQNAYQQQPYGNHPHHHQEHGQNQSGSPADNTRR